MSSEPPSFQLRAWDGRREDLLAASPCIVPEGMNKQALDNTTAPHYTYFRPFGLKSIEVL